MLVPQKGASALKLSGLEKQLEFSLKPSWLCYKICLKLVEKYLLEAFLILYLICHNFYDTEITKMKKQRQLRDYLPVLQRPPAIYKKSMLDNL